jgi:histidine ammonia-lyase
MRMTLHPDVAAAVRANAVEANAAALTGAAYGRTTGVGANRDVAADDSDDLHGMRLVRSHATGAGTVLGAEVGRATMLIRAHQLAAPGSGLPHDVLEALTAAINDGRVPPVRALGGIGTGDIAVLGEVALCLLGERPWLDGEVCPYLEHIGGNAALAFMSSSAPTLAVAALAAESLRRLTRSSLLVAAMGLAAVRANPQQWSHAAAAARPSDGVVAVVSLLQRTLRLRSGMLPARRILCRGARSRTWRGRSGRPSTSSAPRSMPVSVPGPRTPGSSTARCGTTARSCSRASACGSTPPGSRSPSGPPPRWPGW